jgi:hypothetical protein
VEGAVAGEEAVGHEGVEVWMEVEVLAEGVGGEDEGGMDVGEMEGSAVGNSRLPGCRRWVLCVRRRSANSTTGVPHGAPGEASSQLTFLV